VDVVVTTLAQKGTPVRGAATTDDISIEISGPVGATRCPSSAYHRVGHRRRGNIVKEASGVESQ
jgi:hypothetical protein